MRVRATKIRMRIELPEKRLNVYIRNKRARGERGRKERENRRKGLRQVHVNYERRERRFLLSHAKETRASARQASSLPCNTYSNTATASLEQVTAAGMCHEEQGKITGVVYMKEGSRGKRGKQMLAHQERERVKERLTCSCGCSRSQFIERNCTMPFGRSFGGGACVRWC